MDAKITLSFNKEVIEKAKDYAADRGMSLSRLTELIYEKLTSGNARLIDDLPIADWVNMVAEERIEYRRTPSRKKMKSDFFDSKK